MQIRHIHRLCLQLCTVFWAESIRTRFFFVQIVHSKRSTFSTLSMKIIFYETDVTFQFDRLLVKDEAENIG